MIAAMNQKGLFHLTSVKEGVVSCSATISKKRLITTYYPAEGCCFFLNTSGTDTYLDGKFV